MSITKVVLVSALFVATLQEIYGHGKLMDPINRSSVWTLKTFRDVLTNNEDNENFCGGFAIQYNVNGGKCGPCGDDYRQRVPRKNENGGRYGKGHVVRTYKSGATINALVDLTANHLGYFEFSICKLANPSAIETEECFNRYPLKVITEDGKVADKYPAGTKSRKISLKVILPQGLTCDRCVLRWHYKAGNNWGICDPATGRGAKGCGDQETFRSCSDIAIH